MSNSIDANETQRVSCKAANSRKVLTRLLCKLCKKSYIYSDSKSDNICQKCLDEKF